MVGDLDMKQIIEIMGEKFESTAMHIVAEYAHYNFTTGIAFCILGVLILAVSVYALYRLFCEQRKMGEEDLEPDGGFFVVAVLSVAFFIFGLIMFMTNIGDVLSPEASAIKDLLKELRLFIN
jgi:hypothetical protein